METVLGIIFVVFGILQIVLFFKFWGMTNDVRIIKEKLLNTDNTPQEHGHRESGESKLGIDTLVVHVDTGKQMRIKAYNPTNGTYSCYTNGGTIHEGDFNESELKSF